MKKLFLNILALLVLSTSAFASEYPSDYPYWSDSKSYDFVQIKRDLQGSGAVALNILYQGALSKSQNLSAVVRITYLDGVREATFPMSRYGDAFYVRVTNGCLVGSLGGCATPGTDAMKYLLQWAGRMPMTLNALNVELAFVNENGTWDSRNRANYPFHFDEVRSY